LYIAFMIKTSPFRYRDSWCRANYKASYFYRIFIVYLLLLFVHSVKCD